MAWLAVAIGGALGSLARHAVNHAVHRRWPVTDLPFATLAVNVAGCFVAGLLAGLIAAGRITPRLHWREFVFVGVLGGFTTFSTFGLDTFTLLRTGPHSAFANVLAHIALGLAAVYGGYAIGVWR